MPVKARLQINTSVDRGGKTLTLQTQSRDELIAVGKLLAVAVQNVDKDRPWLVDNCGRNSSGKSLIALALDSVLTSDLYPGGLTKDHTANQFLQAEPGHSPHTVLFNFYYEPVIGKDKYDQRMNDLVRYYGYAAPEAKVIFMQNLHRSKDGSGILDYPAVGMQSNLLDLAIRTDIVGEPPADFARKVTMTFADNTLLDPFMAALHGRLSSPAPKNSEPQPIRQTIRRSLEDVLGIS